MSKKPLLFALVFLTVLIAWVGFIAFDPGAETNLDVASEMESPLEVQESKARRGTSASADKKEAESAASHRPASAGKMDPDRDQAATDWFEIRVVNEAGEPAAAARLRIVEAWSAQGSQHRSTQRRLSLLQGEDLVAGETDDRGVCKVRRSLLPENFAVTASKGRFSRVVAGRLGQSRLDLQLQESVRLLCHLQASRTSVVRATLSLRYSLADRVAYLAYPVVSGEEIDVPQGGTLTSAQAEGVLPWQGSEALVSDFHEFTLAFGEALSLRVRFTGVMAEHREESAQLVVLTERGRGRVYPVELGRVCEIVVDPSHPNFGLSLDSRRYRLFEEVNHFGQVGYYALDQVVDGRLDVKLVRAPTLTGRVFGEGEPLAGIALVLLPSSTLGALPSESSAVRVVSDDEGRFRFDGTPLGTNIILVDSKKWTPRLNREVPNLLAKTESDPLFKTICLPSHAHEKDLHLVRSAQINFRLRSARGDEMADFAADMIAPYVAAERFVRAFAPQLAQAWKGKVDLGMRACPGGSADGSGQVQVTAIPHLAKAKFRVRYLHPETAEPSHEDVEVALVAGQTKDVVIVVGENRRYSIRAQVQLDGVRPQRLVRARLLNLKHDALATVDVINGVAHFPEVLPGTYFLRFQLLGEEEVIDEARASRIVVRDRNLQFSRQLYSARSQEFELLLPPGDWEGWKVKVGVLLRDRIGLGRLYRIDLPVSGKDARWTFEATLPTVCDARIERVTLTGPRVTPDEPPPRRIFYPAAPDEVLVVGSPITVVAK